MKLLECCIDNFFCSVQFESRDETNFETKELKWFNVLHFISIVTVMILCFNAYLHKM